MASNVQITIPAILDLFSCLSPYPIILILIYSLVRLSRAVATDYNEFLLLGPGGVPSTPIGYIRVCLVSLFALQDPSKPPLQQVPPPFKAYFGSHKFVQQRYGPKPQVAGVVPHRQITQQASQQYIQALKDAIRTLAATEKHLFLGTSCLEKHGLALFFKPKPNDQDTDPTTAQQHTVYRSSSHCSDCVATPEIAHVHDFDGSVHLMLHPEDIKAIIKHRRGQRHPLAGRWLHTGLTLVFAPRDGEEVDAVVDIVCAAIWWVSNGQICL